MDIKQGPLVPTYQKPIERTLFPLQVSGLIIGISSLLGVFLGIKSSHNLDKKRHKTLLLGLYFVILAMTVNKLYF